ncbi:hypothetical protein LTR08_001777 [Meristemomyces frigidus]|nr:hypothetical protein LTR08_001777 [Meristemomyces frigidus]
MHDLRSASDSIAANGQANTGLDSISQRSAVHEPYKSLSMSSAGGSSLVTPMSSMDLEKSIKVREQAPIQLDRDPEKEMNHAGNGSQQPINIGDSASTSYSDRDGEEDDRTRQEDKSLNILLFLSGPCVLLSALNMVWACISLIVTTLTQPVRLCAKRPTFAQQLAGLLGPALNLQLRRIYTPLAPHADEDSSYRTFMLVMVHVISPFLSLGMMVVAWVLAVYWASSAVVGDPAGMDKRDDGREAVLWLRGRWECWLLHSVKEQ